MTVKISVAMATYNGEKYIKQQLDTIASQTYLPSEIVICDDGSTDSTISLIEDFATLAPFPVVIIRNENNLGFANNFLKCASNCTGDWIAFCDQDDIWLPKKLEVINDVIEKSSDDLVLVYHVAELVDENLTHLGRRLPVIQHDNVKSICDNSGFWFVGGCVMCFKSCLLSGIDSSIRPRDNYQYNKDWATGYPWMPHDKWVCMLANISGNVAAVSQVLSLYRRHDFALTGSHDKDTAANRLKQSSVTGCDSYNFLSMISLETAYSLSRLSESAQNPFRKNRLNVGSENFREISDLFLTRSKLYSSNNIISKVCVFCSLISKKAYFGTKFTSMGSASFLKDFLFVFGFLNLYNKLGGRNDA